LTKIHAYSTSLSHQYDDPQYIRSLKILQEDERVAVLGICNFDTKRLKEIIDNGINVATNQVQVSYAAGEEL
jgi:diketogulonate reductase-like aldo/keto reductase